MLRCSKKVYKSGESNRGGGRCRKKRFPVGWVFRCDVNRPPRSLDSWTLECRHAVCRPWSLSMLPSALVGRAGAFNNRAQWNDHQSVVTGRKIRLIHQNLTLTSTELLASGNMREKLLSVSPQQKMAGLARITGGRGFRWAYSRLACEPALTPWAGKLYRLPRVWSDDRVGREFLAWTNVSPVLGGACRSGFTRAAIARIRSRRAGPASRLRRTGTATAIDPQRRCGAGDSHHLHLRPTDHHRVRL